MESASAKFTNKMRLWHLLKQRGRMTMAERTWRFAHKNRYSKPAPPTDEVFNIVRPFVPVGKIWLASYFPNKLPYEIRAGLSQTGIVYTYRKIGKIPNRDFMANLMREYNYRVAL